MDSLSDLVDVVIGVDTHKDTHTAAVVNAATGGKLAELTVAADPGGYAALFEVADAHGGLRAWSIEGAGGYGAGLARYLAEAGELVIELDRPKRAARRHGAKSDEIDAVRAAREALGRTHLAQPKAPGERAALAVLLAARRSAVDAASALRTLARRALSLAEEAKDHEREILAIVRAWRPDLLDQTGVGPIVAATVLCAWSHPGRVRSDAAFAMLAGACPIPASSGLTTRHRLNRSGDRQLNRALHTVALARLRYDQRTRAYAERRRAEGKTDRDIKRCLKRYIARDLYRLLENPPSTT